MKWWLQTNTSYEVEVVKFGCDAYTDITDLLWSEFGTCSIDWMITSVITNSKRVIFKIKFRSENEALKFKLMV